MVDCLVAGDEIPDVDELDLLRDVREHQSGFPFILCAGDGVTSHASEAIAAGVSDYVPKSQVSDEPSALAERIKREVEQFRETRQRERLMEQRDKLELLNQMLRHDIRNDLQLVLTYLGLAENYIDDEDGQEYIENVTESITNAIDLTKRARELSEAILAAEASEKLPLDEVLRDQIETVEATHDDDAELSVDGSLPEVEVWANDLLDSVFYNLLQNAIEHNDKEVPEVTVSAMTTDHTVTVEIADNGPGIEEDDIFLRGEKGTDSEGTGMGLYLVDTVVSQYDGDVWVEDREAQSASSNRTQSDDNDSEGTIFAVELPRAD
jgi:signal transduction histidine kinase